MIPYIGDISINDSRVLREMAETHNNILEFGCGASTQVLSSYSKHKILSVDTSQEWVDKTKNNIGLLEIENMPIFKIHASSSIYEGVYDFVFNDGVDSLRKDFALKIWGNIRIGGILAFHDTRRWQDAKTVCNVLEQIYESVDNVIFNYNHSNITLVYKKEKEPYDNWQITENKEQWQIGYGEPDVEYIKSKIK